MPDPSPKPGRSVYDPTFLHARREAIVIVALFVAFCVWSVGVCHGSGYPSESRADIATTFGMPSWVFWGICLPWIAVDVVAVWFCFFFMQDDDLGVAHEDDGFEQATEGEQGGGGEL